MEIKDYPSYLIYDDGRVYSKERRGTIGGFLKYNVSRKGYNTVKLYNIIGTKHLKVHRLVALHYIPNPNNYPQVDHINRDKLDNRVENLRWANQSMQSINKGVQKNNELGLKNIHKDQMREYTYYVVVFKRNGLLYRKYLKTKEDAIKQRDLMLSMFP